MDENPWQTLDSKIVYQNPWLTVHEDKVIHPGGSEGIYSVVDCKDGVFVVAEDAFHNVYIMEAYRYPMKRWSWEIPSGGIEVGDSPEVAARKELQEELGLTSNEWISLGEFAPSHNGCMTDRQHIFVAQNCLAGEHAREDGEAIRTVKKVTRDELFELVRSGHIKDGQTNAALLFYKLWIEQSEQ